MGFTAGGIAAALNGYQQGQDDQVARVQKKADSAFLEESRNQQRQQWQRDDQLRTDNAAVPMTKQVTDTTTQTSADGAQAPGGGTFGADAGKDDPTAGDNQSLAPTPAAPTAVVQKTSTVPTSEDERLRAMGDNYLKAGKTDQYMAMHKQADEIGAKRSAAAFAQLANNAATLSPEQLLARAKDIYNNDPFAGQVQDYKVNADGTMTVNFVNKRTGQAMSKTVASKDELIKDLQAYYSPETANALLLKEAEERMKTHNVPAGGALVRNDGKTLFQNNNGFIQDGFNADGTPRIIKGGNGGAGGLGKNGKTPQTVYDESGKIIDTSLKGTPEQIAAAHATKDAVLQQNPGMSAGQVAKIATDVVLHPELVQPRFDTKTGAFMDTYTGGGMKLDLGTRPDLKTFVQRLGGEDKARAAITQQLQALPAPVAQKVQEGAADPAAAQRNAQQISANAGTAAAQAYLSNVEAAKFAGAKSGIAGLWSAARQAVAGPAGAPASPGQPQPQAQPGGPAAPLPSTVGADIGQRTAQIQQQQTQARQAQSARDLDQMFKDDAAKKAAQRQVAGITPQVIAAMTPQEATRTLAQFQPVLSTEQVSALQNAIAMAQRPATARTPL